MSSMKHTRHFWHKLGKKENTWKNKDLDDSSSFTESSDSCLLRMHVSLRVFHEDPCSLLPVLPAEETLTLSISGCARHCPFSLASPHLLPSIHQVLSPPLPATQCPHLLPPLRLLLQFWFLFFILWTTLQNFLFCEPLSNPSSSLSKL